MILLEWEVKMTKTYYVTYYLSNQVGQMLGSIYMTFSNPTIFNLKMTQKVIQEQIPAQFKDVLPLILNWKELTADEVLLNVQDNKTRGN